MEKAYFPAATYRRRRQELKNRIGTGLLLFMGNEESSMNFKDNWYPFRQDSSFLYYAGIDRPGLVLILDLDENREVLIGENPGMDEIIWTGPQPGLEDLAASSGIEMTGNYEYLYRYLQKIIGQSQAIHLLPPYRPENRIKLVEWLKPDRGDLRPFISETLIRAVIGQRERKEPVEIEEMDKAVSLSADMHLAVIAATSPGRKEYELAAKAEEVALAANGRLSYPSIITVNGQTLHNHFYGNTIREGRIVLCDAGAETAAHYAGDLTRSFPVAKHFTTTQLELYEVVLRALDHAVSLLKPEIPFLEVHLEACVKLSEGLISAGLMKGNAREAVQAGAHTLFFQCGLGHMIGLDVHDMEDLGEPLVGYDDRVAKRSDFGWKSLRLGKALQEGFTLTVEPGIYIIPELLDIWKAEKKFPSFINYDILDRLRNFGGIRIEDNFLITAGGCRKLGKHLPRTAREIENLRQAG